MERGKGANRALFISRMSSIDRWRLVVDIRGAATAPAHKPTEIRAGQLVEEQRHRKTDPCQWTRERAYPGLALIPAPLKCGVLRDTRLERLGLDTAEEHCPLRFRFGDLRPTRPAGSSTYSTGGGRLQLLQSLYRTYVLKPRGKFVHRSAQRITPCRLLQGEARIVNRDS